MTRGTSQSHSPRARTTATRVRQIRLHAFLVTAAALWLAPFAYAVLASLRTPLDTQAHGYLSLPRALTLANYRAAWTFGDMPRHFLNTLIIVAPALVLVLAFSSSIAFVLARLPYWFNGPMLAFFTAASLLPQQVLIIPLFQLYIRIPLPQALSDKGLMYDSYLGVILIHIAFQTGFCTFVLANFMKTLPSSVFDAARVDGASLVRQYVGIALPLTRPALGAVAALAFTWIYNDFFWALTLIQNQDRQPVVTATGDVFSDHFDYVNGVAEAQTILIMIPTLAVFLFLRRQFVSGLTLGAAGDA